MVQFNYPRVINQFVWCNFWVHCVVPFSLHAEQGKYCICLLVNKVENHFSNIGFMESKWPNLIMPGSYTNRCEDIWGPLCYPFFFAYRKTEMLHVACYYSGKSFFKYGFCEIQMVQFNYPRVILQLLRWNFGDHCIAPFSLCARKGRCCMWFVTTISQI